MKSKWLVGIDDRSNTFDNDVTIAMNELSTLQRRKRSAIRRNPETLNIKRVLSELRRKEFNSDRNRLMLEMIANGIEYICNFNECEIKEKLHLDHVIPLSKGGSDKIENLQFLCRFHNLSKSDRKLKQKSPTSKD